MREVSSRFLSTILSNFFQFEVGNGKGCFREIIEFESDVKTKVFRTIFNGVKFDFLAKLGSN